MGNSRRFPPSVLLVQDKQKKGLVFVQTNEPIALFTNKAGKTRLPTAACSYLYSWVNQGVGAGTTGSAHTSASGAVQLRDYF